MMQGKLSCGFEYKLEDKVLDNMELVDAIAEADVNPIAVSRVIQMLLGTEQKKRLYDHLRTEDGRIPIKDITMAVVEIFNNSGQSGKKS